MKLLDRLAARMGYLPRTTAGASRPRSLSLRMFDAADTDNTTFGFRSDNASADQVLLGALTTLRGRSRTLAMNNDYARKFLRMVTTNVVGPDGFTLQSLVMTSDGASADKGARTQIENEFRRWSQRGNCDVTGTLSLRAVTRLLAETVARDGEAIVRRVRGRGVNRWGFALQVLDIDRLPVTMNSTADNGNAIRMGIELDGAGRPVAYHLCKSHPNGGMLGLSSETERVPASDVCHLFVADRAEQRRGVPWMHTSMLRLEHLGKFERAAVVAARKGAQTLGFFQSPDGGPPPGDDQDADGNEIHTSVEGEFDTLPPGYQFQKIENDYPNQVFGEFVKASLRGIAAGLGVAYNGLANDLEGVNYSSIRAGLLEERDVWRDLQSWMVESLLAPVFEDWLAMAQLSKAVNLPLGGYDRFVVHAFQPRGFAWVDPQRDMEANLMQLRAGLKTRRAIAAEQGADLDDVLAQLAVEEAEIARLRLKLDNGGSAAAVGAGKAAAANEDDAKSSA